MIPADATVGELGLLVGHALEEQLELQLEVAKAEVARDAKTVLRQLAPLALSAGAAGVGFVFLLVGIAMGLAPWTGSALSAALVGASVVASAALGARAALSDPEARWILPDRRAGGSRVR